MTFFGSSSIWQRAGLVGLAVLLLAGASVAQSEEEREADKQRRAAWEQLPARQGQEIQQSINSAGAGEVVIVPRGRYTLAQPLLFRPGITLKGEKLGEVVLMIDAFAGEAIRAKEASSGSIEALTLVHGNRRGGEENPLILTLDSSISIRNCELFDAGRDGIWIRGRGKVEVVGCSITGSERHGIHATGHDAEPVIRDCRLVRNGDRRAREGREGAGVQFHEKAKGTVTGCTCRESTWGIRVTGNETKGFLEKNICTANLTGIKYEKGASGNCKSNACTGNDRYGIHLSKRSGYEPELRDNDTTGNGIDGLKKD